MHAYTSQATKIKSQGSSIDIPVYPQVNSGPHQTSKTEQLAKIAEGYMYTTIGSSGRECLLIISLQLYGPRVKHFEGNFFSGLVSTTPPTFILEELIQY